MADSYLAGRYNASKSSQGWVEGIGFISWACSGESLCDGRLTYDDTGPDEEVGVFLLTDG